MPKIVVALDTPIACPHCAHEFPLESGITRHALEHYADAFDAFFAEQRKVLRDQVVREVTGELAAPYEEKLSQLNQQSAAHARAADDARANLVKAREEARAAALADNEAVRRALAAELSAKQEQVRQFQEQELALRREKQQLEEATRGLELEVQRKLDAERARIREDALRAETEKFALREAEYQKQLADARRAHEEMSRKLDQRSQQLQGEVLELEVEHVLVEAFRADTIEPVKVGTR
ncbi:MAG: DUF2130 domain-containing protein, partial [Betaproteobacteria bacterium]|nr:DUF2130 domain-containing protein [Betaproteobacteria bacterium]